MTNKEIFDAIEKLQYVIDKHAKSGKYEFASQDDVKLLELVYNFITKRQYIKFNAGCSSCVKEAFIILSNWQKREEAKAEFEKTIADIYSGEKGDGKVVDMTEVEFTPEVVESIKELKDLILDQSPEKRGVKSKEEAEAEQPIQKPKSNGRSKRK